MRLNMRALALVFAFAFAFAFAIAISTSSAFAKSPTTRDWKEFPAVVEAEQPRDLYALGDVHGDEQRLVELLAATHIIATPPAAPTAVKWSAGKAVLVCTGDMIDKYNQSIEVIDLMRALQSSAVEQGGRVIITMGNHEAEFLASGGRDKKGAEFIDELVRDKIDPVQTAAGADDRGLGEWLRDLPIAAKVGGWFFCHAGNTGGLTIEQLESDAERGIDANGFGSAFLSDPNSILEARMHPRPWWDWDGSLPELKNVGHKSATASTGESRLRAGLEALHVQHLVFGHQPGRIRFDDGTERAADQMIQKFNGLVFLIDTGMSRGVDSGRAALLHIHEGNKHTVASAEYADGAVDELFKN